MKTTQIASNPTYTGRNVRVIDKVWVMAKQPESTIADWVASHPKPERSGYSDDAAYEP